MTTPRTPSSFRSGWTALGVTVLARVLLGVLVSLLLWAVLPAALGWKPTVVMTGSMLPRLHVGDVVVSKPVAPAERRPGQVLLYDDPDRAGHLRLHRWVGTTADGRLVTRGDANPADDSTPVSPAAVHGVGVLRVPLVATPVVWAAEGRTVPLVLLGAGLLGVVAAACLFRAADDDDDDADDAPDAGLAGDDPATDAPGARRPDAGRRRGPLIRVGLTRAGVTLAVVVATGAANTTAADAATAFSATTTGPNSSFAGATYFSCASAARTSSARFSLPLDEGGGSARDITGNGPNGNYQGSTVAARPGPCRPDGTNATWLDGTSGAVTVNAQAVSLPDITFQVWFYAAAGSPGGTLLSLTAAGTNGGADTTYLAAGLNGSGALVAGAVDQAGGVRRIGVAGDLRDARWHQLTVVAGGSGLVLHLDGVEVARDNGLTSAAQIQGIPVIGYGNSQSLGLARYFRGAVAFATLWKASLSGATVLATYRAAA